jgi:hypothetical protein
MKNNCLWLSLVMVAFSCQKQENAFKILLTRQGTYWIHHSHPEDEANSLYPYCKSFSTSQNFLSTTNSYQNFLIGEDGLGLSEPINIDGPNSDRGNWSFSDQDSTLIIAGYKFKVTRYSRDTIMLKTTQGHVESLIRLYKAHLTE